MKTKKELLAELEQVKKEKEEIIAALKFDLERFTETIKWLHSIFQFGDIVEQVATGKRCVVMSFEGVWPYGVFIKKNGKLGRMGKNIYVRKGYGEGKYVICGRYEGEDLPEPSEAAKIGLKYREVEK